MDEPVEVIVRRNLFNISGNLYSETMLSHRSAFEFIPTKTGQIFLTTSYIKKKLVFLVLNSNFLKGQFLFKETLNFSTNYIFLKGKGHF
jgi:hypothetical protein